MKVLKENVSVYDDKQQKKLIQEALLKYKDHGPFNVKKFAKIQEETDKQIEEDAREKGMSKGKSEKK